MQDQRFAHMDDNRVEYYGQSLGNEYVDCISITTSTHNLFNSVSPNTFRPGDIVEVSIEFCLYPSAKGSAAVIQLKAVRMLNPEYRYVSTLVEV